MGADAARAGMIPPRETEIVVIGGGVAGVATAYYLAEAGVPVVLCEKGRIAGEQSSRNWGWVRKQGRDPRELPLAIDALRRWGDLAGRLREIGYHVGGIAYLSESEADLAAHEAWLAHARAYDLDSRLLSAAETDAMLGQDGRRFRGALFTPSDARAEPSLAVPALAAAARDLGAVIFENTAVRALDLGGGRVAGVHTEHGRIGCRAVLLAGGAWSRIFLENEGLDLPQLSVKSSVLRTAPGPLVTQAAVGASKAGFRRRLDGGYTVARTSSSTFDIVPAAFRHFRAFLPALAEQWRTMRLRFGRPFFEALGQRRWRPDQLSPFEQARVLAPTPDGRLLDDVMMSLGELFPQLSGLAVAERWAGMIDVTPDEIPVLGPVAARPGLFLATGLSGHGFGVGPAIGAAMAEILRGREPAVDLHDFRPARFAERGGVSRPGGELPI